MVDPTILTDLWAILQSLKDMGIGDFMKPVTTRLQAKAEIAALKELSAAQQQVAIQAAASNNEVAAIALDGEIERDMRRVLAAAETEAVREILRFQLATAERQFRNMGDITAGTAELLLESGEKPKMGEVAPGWFAAFFEECKNVSDKEMHDVWSRMLAGEISEPGSFSLRTISTARELSKKEWMLLDELTEMLWWCSGNPLLAILPGPGCTITDEIWPLLGIDYPSFLFLKDAGLISLGENSYIEFSPGKFIMEYGDKKWSVEKSALPDAESQRRRMKLDGRYILRCVVLSTTGRELARLRPRKEVSVVLDAVRNAFDLGGMFLREVTPTNS